MGDVLVVGADRRAALQTGAFALPPPADSLLGRLEKIDHRLRQLEEKQRVSIPVPAAAAAAQAQSNYFTTELLMQERPPGGSGGGNGGGDGEECRRQHHHHHHHHHSQSMPSAFPHHQLHLKGNLIDRLHLLETRIRQLSFELEKGTSGTTAWSTSRPSLTADNTSCILPTVFARAEQCRPQPIRSNTSRVIGGTWRAGRIFQRGAREPNARKPKSKVKDPKEATTSAAEKRTSAMCRNEKRRSERARLCRRWFPVGC